MITQADFSTWREHPVTEWVVEQMVRLSDEQKQAWLDASWETGNADILMLTELRTRADAYRAIPETDYARFCELAGQDPTED